MGEILAATDDQFDRQVAVKRMRDPSPSEHAMGRFFREARIQGQLDHPAIVPVHELGVDLDGRECLHLQAWQRGSCGNWWADVG